MALVYFRFKRENKYLPELWQQTHTGQGTNQQQFPEVNATNKMSFSPLLE